MSKLEINCIISGDNTAGEVAVFEEVVQPAQGPPLHRHLTQNEVFHIISGTFRFHLDGKEFERGTGAAVFIPKGAIHAFKNIGNENGLIHFELFPALRAEEGFHRLVHEETDDMSSLLLEYDIEVVGPPI